MRVVLIKVVYESIIFLGLPVNSVHLQVGYFLLALQKMVESAGPKFKKTKYEHIPRASRSFSWNSAAEFMGIPSIRPCSDIFVYQSKEEVMKKPNVTGIVRGKPMMRL